jgi:ribose transport system substrate-binding protein
MRFLLAALAAGLLLGFAACGGDDNSGSGAGAGDGVAKEKKAVKLALLMPSTSVSYFQSVINGAKEVAGQNNATVDVVAAEYDPQKQLSQCQDAITSGQYQAFLIYPVDGGAIVPCAKSAIAAGIKVVGTGAPIGPDWESLEPQVEGITAFTLPLAQTSGQRLAKLAEMACKGKDPCKLLYTIGNPAFGYDSSLLSNFKQSLPPNLKIVSEVQTNFNPDDGRTKTANALQADPDIDVVVTEDTTARGVVPAVKEAGMSGKVLVVSGGGSETGTAEVKKGTVLGTVPFYPFTAAKVTAEWAIKAARGEKLTGDVMVDEYTLGDVELVTKGTLDDWTPEYE